jgi:hypothetical protein
MVAQNVKLASGVMQLAQGEHMGITGQLWTERMLAPFAAGASFHSYDFASLGSSRLSKWLAEQQIEVFSTFTAAARAMDISQEMSWPKLRMFRMAGEPVLRTDVERPAKAMRMVRSWKTALA